MCKALLPGDDESMNDEAIWETLPVSSFIYPWRYSYSMQLNSYFSDFQFLDFVNSYCNLICSSVRYIIMVDHTVEII